MFEPSEFEIIETIVFEEELQRPEELRFFTLSEQLDDYFDKVLPKKKHISRAEYKKIEIEIDRIRLLYGTNVVVTETDYRIDLSRKSVNVSWVKPIYGNFRYEAYPYYENWAPLFDKSRRSTPNFYPQMLAALPRPYKSEGTSGVPIVKSEILVNEEGKDAIVALGLYNRTKRILHEDSSFDIVSVAVPNTADDIRAIGYYIDERPLEIPTPLSDHPFLSSSKPSKYITNEPLNTIFPSIEAIVSHAVPTTTDPYVEGLKYLKLYDVNIGQIPWSVWKQRFPAADTILSPPPVVSVLFPKNDDIVAPSEDIQKAYGSKWNQAIFPRKWLMNQEDGGQLVLKMILSKAGDAGRVPPETPGEKPVAVFPNSMPDDCLSTESFQDFLANGVYRVNKVVTKEGVCDPYTLNPGQCVPTSYIAQEKSAQISKGKQAWSDTTPVEIMKDHQILLKIFQSIPEPAVETLYEKFDAAETSEMRNHIKIILSDTALENSDKLHNINLLVRNLDVQNNQYLDVNKKFVVCMHTLAELGGDLEHDRLAFYNTWTAVDEGFQACKYCGQRINGDVFVAQDDFDENGNPIVSHDILEERQTYTGESKPVSFTNSLTEMKSLFDANNAGEAILYTVLSIIQILPTESQILPIIGNLREVSAAARRSAKLSIPDKRRVEGILGIAASVVILQIHNPFLIPRRSFGSKILKLSGFPRDTDDPKDSPVLDAVLFSINTAFEAFPNTFKEPVATVLRAIKINKRKVRDETVRYLSQAHTKFKTEFEAAKARYATVEKEVEKNQIQLPIIVPTKYEFSPNERFGAEKMGECTSLKPYGIVAGKMMPSVVQDKLELWKVLNPSKMLKFMVPETFKYSFMFPDTKDITRTFKLGFPKSVKLDAIEAFIKSDTDGIALLSLLNRILNIISTLKYPASKIIPYRKLATSLNTRESPSLVRDAVRGILYKLFDEIKSQDTLIEGLRTAMNRDLGLRMILIKKEDAQAEVNVTRAKERETFKMRMRAMTDEQRDITKKLLDIGIAPFIITNEDREIFAKEYNYEEKAIKKDNADEAEFDEEVPEGGFSRRDLDDDVAVGDNGLPVEVDYGDYGDRADRPQDDYSNTGGQFDFDEGDGI